MNFKLTNFVSMELCKLKKTAVKSLIMGNPKEKKRKKENYEYYIVKQ